MVITIPGIMAMAIMIPGTTATAGVITIPGITAMVAMDTGDGVTVADIIPIMIINGDIIQRTEAGSITTNGIFCMGMQLPARIHG